MKDFEERHGVRIFQAWGMTETSPVADLLAPARGASTTTPTGTTAREQGRPLPWVELRLVDDDGEEVPWDGESTGEIEVRGPWIAARYFRDDRRRRSSTTAGCAPATSPRSTSSGYVQITDRAKDVIKSGGEWISSVELENELMAHPDVRRGGGDRHARRALGRAPAGCVVLREGASVGAEELRRAPRGRVAKWWLPDEFAFIDEVPKTSVGKFDKKVLRGELAEGTLEGRVQRLAATPHCRPSAPFARGSRHDSGSTSS